MELVGLVMWIGLIVLVCLLIPLIWLYVRRQWLIHGGGTFDCELNLGTDQATRWVLGVARYSGEYLEWFRAFALGLRPQQTFRRSATTARGATISDPEGLGGQQMVRLEALDAGETRVWDLAMDRASATGLLAWLEAAPPSVDRFKA